jgi:hypothetical protein
VAAGGGNEGRGGFSGEENELPHWNAGLKQVTRQTAFL